METLYCPKCDRNVAIRIEPTEETYTIRDEEITICSKVAHCPHCSDQIFHEELDNENLNRVYDEFRKRKGFLTPKKIKAIRTQYGLSQRALGRLLKLGEITIHRYENGSLPSDAHNELLILIEEPANVQRLLDRVGSDLSAKEEKNLRARLNDLMWTDRRTVFLRSAEELLSNYEASLFSGFQKFKPEKVQEMAVYFATNTDNLSKTKLMKLFFYSDFLHFKHNGVSISGLRYAHLPYGPAVDNFNTMLNWLEWNKSITLTLTNTAYEWELITSSKKLTGALRRQELKTLKSVLDKFDKLTASELSDYSHKEKAYISTAIGELISYEHALELSL